MAAAVSSWCVHRSVSVDVRKLVFASPPRTLPLAMTSLSMRRSVRGGNALVETELTKCVASPSIGKFVVLPPSADILTIRAEFASISLVPPAIVSSTTPLASPGSTFALEDISKSRLAQVTVDLPCLFIPKPDLYTVLGRDLDVLEKVVSGNSRKRESETHSLARSPRRYPFIHMPSLLFGN